MSMTRIAFRIAGSKPVIYVDLDNTLIVTVRPGEQRFAELTSSDLERAELAHGPTTFLRPGAREMLDELRTVGSVRVCTSGTRSYADDVLKRLDLGRYFDSVTAREDLGGMGVADGPTVLVDNLGPWTSDILDKLETVGTPFDQFGHADDEAFEKAHTDHHAKHLVKVDEWWGALPDDGLSDVAQRARNALELQS